MLRKLLSALLILTVLFSVGVTVVAENNAAVSDNLGKQDYVRYADTVKSYLVPSEDGTLMRIEAIEQQIVIETYNSDLELLHSRSVSYELPIFGGFYESDDSYFLAFGQKNLLEDDSTEVIRVVRYDKAWNRIGAASLYGEKTRMPFAYGSLRMTHSGDILYIRTCHEKYQGADGYYPQSSLTLSIRISSMEITDVLLSDSQPGYVSRSLNQFVEVDLDSLLSVDQGISFPRSVILFRCSTCQPDGLFSNHWESVNVLPISGKNGSYDTGVCVGGFAASDSAYLVAGNSVQFGGTNGVRNIFVSVTPKSVFTEKATKLNWITDYPIGDSSYIDNVSVPQIVTVNDGFLLLWTAKGKLNYAVLNQDGERTGTVMSADAALSDCRPICVENRVIWYCTDNSTPIFYCIDMTSPETVTTISTQKENEPSETSESTEPTEPTPPTPPNSQEECPSRNYIDVPAESHWAHQGIDFAIQNKLFNGMSETLFKPDIPMTRAMLVTVLWRSSGSPEQGMNPFLDVPENVWYTDAVRWASACSIVNGVGSGRFDPNGNTTREQMATILYRFAIYNQENTAQRTDISEFADNQCVSSWAKDAMCWTVAKGIISGSEKHGTRLLLPQEYATRAQVATILMRYLQDQ